VTRGFYRVAVGMTVEDVERSVRFYASVLSFEKVSDVEVTVSASCS
jgi:catechol 2,3-dioxygenase-like lactoylglutathione lyase family enzyme